MTYVHILDFVRYFLVFCATASCLMRKKLLGRERVVPSCSQYYHGSPIYTQVTMERLKMQTLTRLLAATGFKFKIKVSLRSQSRNFPFKINIEVAVYIVYVCIYTTSKKLRNTSLSFLRNYSHCRSVVSKMWPEGEHWPSLCCKFNG